VIAIIGSVNMDISARVEHLPRPGETVLGGRAQIGLGGKGANQAVAARLLEAHEASVRLIASIGGDAFGHEALQMLEKNRVDLEHLHRSSQPTGIALITVDAAAQNSIIVAPGANSDLEPQHVTSEALSGSSVVCISLEIPKATWLEAIRAARASGATVVVNASPLGGVQPSDLEGSAVLVVNQLEAAVLAGLPLETEAITLARALQSIAARVVVTLGANGAVWVGEDDGYAPGVPIHATDTTGAGDTFCGALCVAIAEGATLPNAVHFANIAGALCATRAGTTSAMPTRAEIAAFTELQGA
jgi:ribokinase